MHNANLMSTLLFLKNNTNFQIRLKQYTILGHIISIYDNEVSITGDYVASELNRDEYHLRDINRLGKIKHNDTLLDLGSNIGITAILLAKMWPTIRVIGIEPIPYNYALALRNVDINGVADRVIILPGALASNVTEISIRYSFANHGSSTSSKEFFVRGSDDTKGHEDFTVFTVTVDEILQHFGINYVPFIKLDCEGCEYDIIPHLSPEALAIFKDALVFGEVHSDRMPVSPDVASFVHGIFSAYSVGRKLKKRWRPH